MNLKRSTSKSFLTIVFFVLLFYTFFFSSIAEGQEDPLRISEICASCSAYTLKDKDGDSPDWIELQNTGLLPLQLSDYRLGKSVDPSKAYPLPDVTLSPEQTLLILCSGKSNGSDEEYHLPFKLSAAGDQLVLFRHDLITDRITFGAQEKNTSLIRQEDGEYRVTYTPTPGKENSFTEAADKDVIGIITINEIMTSAAPFYKTYGFDWVELKNPGLHPVNISGWKIVLNSDQCYTFEDTVIQCTEYLKVYMEDQTLYNVINTGFTLPASGGVLELIDDHGILVSRVQWPKHLLGNISYGLPGDKGETYRFLAKDSFGYENTTIAYDEQTAEVTFSITGGYCSDTILLELSCEDDAVIYYTLDGSDPQKKGKVYTQPIRISETTVIRAAAKHPEKLFGQSRSETYIYGISRDFALVSIVTDPDYLYDPDQGILVSGNKSIENYKQEWQYPANIEYYDETGECGLNQLASMAIAGEISRNKAQKSFVFFARNAYGNDRFSFNPFPNRNYSKIKSFVLRNSGSEGVSNGIRFNDALLTGLAIKNSHCLASDARPVLVLLNGKVWGHMNIRERMNKYTIAALENVPEDQINEIDILTDNGTVMQGSSDDYKLLTEYMKSHDPNDPEVLAFIESQMDIDSYFDSVIWQLITGNQDLSNSRWYRTPGGKWKWMIYDLDAGMTGTGTQTFTYYFTPLNKTSAIQFDHIPFGTLIRVPAIKDSFLKRTAYVLENSFAPDDLAAEFDNWYERLNPIMPYHFERWTGLTRSMWEENIVHARKIYCERPLLIVDYIQEYFQLTNEETAFYFGAFQELY